MKLTGVDNGTPSGDNFDLFALQRTTQATNPYDCSHLPDSALTTNTDGDFTVVDASAPRPLPTSKDECQNGGWKRFPGFRNQGQCVSFVASNGKHQPAA